MTDTYSSRRRTLARALDVLGPGFLRRVVEADIQEEPEVYDPALLVRHSDHNRIRHVLAALGATGSDIDELFRDPDELVAVLAEDLLSGINVRALCDEIVDDGDPLGIPGVCSRVQLTIQALLGSVTSRHCVSCGTKDDGPVCSDCLGLG